MPGAGPPVGRRRVWAGLTDGVAPPGNFCRGPWGEKTHKVDDSNRVSERPRVPILPCTFVWHRDNGQKFLVGSRRKQ